MQQAAATASKVQAQETLDAATKAALQFGLTRCFDEVPSVFFDSNFTLQDPAVFDKVCIDIFIYLKLYSYKNVLCTACFVLCLLHSME